MQAFAYIINLAEEEGLEPSDAGIKTQCLNQLGDSPIFFIRQSKIKRFKIKILKFKILNLKDAELTLLQQTPAFL